MIKSVNDPGFCVTIEPVDDPGFCQTIEPVNDPGFYQTIEVNQNMPQEFVDEMNEIIVKINGIIARKKDKI
jgi:hypothetical protein